MNSIELLSPLSSKKELPKNHNIEARYQSYDKAKDYIKHLSRVYDNTLLKSAEYDASCVESINFRSKLPQLNGKFKLSNYPASHLSKELFEKMTMINAYNQLSEIKISKVKFRPKSTVFPSPKEAKTANKEKDEANYTKIKHSYCSKCRLRPFQCECKSPIRKLEWAKSLNSPPSLKLANLRDSFPGRRKNNRYFTSLNENTQNPLAISLDHTISLSPRKQNFTTLHSYG